MRTLSYGVRISHRTPAQARRAQRLGLCPLGSMVQAGRGWCVGQLRLEGPVRRWQAPLMHGLRLGPGGSDLS